MSVLDSGLEGDKDLMNALASLFRRKQRQSFSIFIALKPGKMRTPDFCGLRVGLDRALRLPNSQNIQRLGQRDHLGVHCGLGPCFPRLANADHLEFSL